MGGKSLSQFIRIDTLYLNKRNNIYLNNEAIFVRIKLLHIPNLILELCISQGYFPLRQAKESAMKITLFKKKKKNYLNDKAFLLEQTICIFLALILELYVLLGYFPLRQEKESPFMQSAMKIIFVHTICPKF